MRGSLAITLTCATTLAHAGDRSEFMPPAPFQLLDPAVGNVRPGHPTQPWATSSRIAAVGDGALVIDADSGMLIRTDATGARVAQLAIGADAGLLAYDAVAKLAYIADRRGDRLIVVDVERFAIARMWKTPAEPYGVALTPDRSTVLVTAIADRVAVAYDATTGRERWRVELDPEPRGIAISADGKRAVVGTLATGALDELELESGRLRRLALPTEVDTQRARGAFAVTFLGDHELAAPFQIDVPVPTSDESSETYGATFTPPVTYDLAFLDGTGRTARAVIAVNEPRAVAWDPARDALYVVGLAADSIVQVDHASQVDVAPGLVGSLGGQRCGADGLAIAAGGAVLVWCSFTRAIVRVEVGARLAATTGPELVASSLDATRHQGLVLFHTAEPAISAFGGESCGSCHLDGRADGLSWRIRQTELQTPMLAGRLVGTAPFKWDGTARDLTTSVRSTVRRLGGEGLSRRRLVALASYLESMPPVRTPSRDRAAVARGQALFESVELGCASCHDGVTYTDRERHSFGTAHAFDTPSLVGLAASAPYFHDGSAPTLDAVLRDQGSVHGMATDAAIHVTDAQLADLRAFLETR